MTKAPSFFNRMPFFIRLFHWEYWPRSVVYGPIYLYWFWLSLRARSFFFFNTANPTIPYGGLVMDSKIEIDAILPASHKPVTIYFEAGTPVQKVESAILERGLSFPMILKPDIGLQGKSVVLIKDLAALQTAVSQFTVPFLIQEYIAYENEIGIFYVRQPGEATGKITGIVEKRFVSVTGDGFSSIKTLLSCNPRYILQWKNILTIISKKELDRIPAKDEKVQVLPYGNHARGCMFLDSSHWIDQQLETVIDATAKKIPGFYYGRLDIKFKSLEDLKNDQYWYIIELNGAGSDPTHMYDPSHSLFFAWKEIIRHWKLLFDVSVANQSKGHSFLGFREGIDLFRNNSNYIKKISKQIV